MKTKLKTILPLLIFIVIGYVFVRGLGLDLHFLPSVFINKAVPEFNVPELYHANKILNRDIFKNHVSLLNVWASWCSTCMMEHVFLMEVVRKYPIKLYGLDYKDERENAKDFLQQFGNPYAQIGFDQDGNTAMNWGVYGTPETFVIDKKGMIRYKQLGPITEDDWNQTLLPLIKKLEQE